MTLPSTIYCASTATNLSWSLLMPNLGTLDCLPKLIERWKKFMMMEHLPPRLLNMFPLRLVLRKPKVGVEHLLRDIKDTTVGTLSQKITNQLMGLKGLEMKLSDMHNYMQQVVDGKLPMNHQITYLLQDIFNLLPDVTNPQFVKSINVNTNDQMLVVYTSSLIRSIIALHNLINNKLTNKEAEKREGKKDDKDKDKDKKEDKEKDKETKDEKKEKSKK